MFFCRGVILGEPLLFLWVFTSISSSSLSGTCACHPGGFSVLSVAPVNAASRVQIRFSYILNAQCSVQICIRRKLVYVACPLGMMHCANHT